MDLLHRLFSLPAALLAELETRRELSALDDRALSDIGIERGGIAAVAAAATRGVEAASPRQTAVLIRQALGTRAV